MTESSCFFVVVNVRVVSRGASRLVKITGTQGAPSTPHCIVRGSGNGGQLHSDDKFLMRKNRAP